MKSRLSGGEQMHESDGNNEREEQVEEASERTARRWGRGIPAGSPAKWQLDKHLRLRRQRWGFKEGEWLHILPSHLPIMAINRGANDLCVRVQPSCVQPSRVPFFFFFPELPSLGWRGLMQWCAPFPGWKEHPFVPHVRGAPGWAVASAAARAPSLLLAHFPLNLTCCVSISPHQLSFRCVGSAFFWMISYLLAQRCDITAAL